MKTVKVVQNNVQVREPVVVTARMTMIAMNEKDVYHLVNIARNPRLKIIQDEKPVEISQNVWSIKCQLIYKKS